MIHFTIAMNVASLHGTFIDCNAEFERLSQTPKAESVMIWIVTAKIFVAIIGIT
jgi:hypothetical protein